ncbi:cytidylyltransferase domain-containing protein [Aquirufa ecclesiirivi]
MGNSKLLILVQARTGSSRFPNKVLKPVLDKPILIHQLERIQSIQRKAEIVVITSLEPEDDAIVEISKKYGFPVFRGSLNDLLDRHYQAAKAYDADWIVKIPSDCPLIDPQIIDEVFDYCFLHEGEFDFVSNLHPASYPDGNDVEMMTFSALEKAWKEAKRPFEREHTTPYFWENPSLFSIGNWEWKSGLKYDMSHRFTLDYPEDLTFIDQVYQHLYFSKPLFGLDDILPLLQAHPKIYQINSSYAGVNWYRNHLHELRTIGVEQTNMYHEIRKTN